MLSFQLKNIIQKLRDDNKNIISVPYIATQKLIQHSTAFFKNWPQNHYKLFLILFIVVSFLIRAPYVRFGLPYQHNWDEPALVNKSVQILQTGDFNPHFFNYPSLTTYMLLPFFIMNYYALASRGSVANIQDVKIGPTSHWSFYATGRLVMVLLAMLSIFFVYHIGRIYINRKVGLLSALILCFFLYHEQFLIVISPNPTVSFFVLATLYFLSLYIEKKNQFFLFLSGLAAGFTVAAKYNAFIVVIPIILGILFYSGKIIRDFFLILPSTALGFFIGCPYALLDLSTFLDHTATEVSHYRGGHKSYEGTPGLPQIKFYLSVFKDWTKSTFHVGFFKHLPFLGLAFHAFTDIKNFLILSSFPILYLLYMSLQRVNFIRNMICMIPFISIFAAFIFYAIYKLFIALFNYLIRKNLIKFKVSPEAIFIIYCLVLFLCFNPVGKIIDGYEYLTTYRESRTIAINYIRDNYPNANIGISKELKIHPSDLQKLKNKVLIDTASESLKDIYNKNLNYMISSDRYASFRKREGDADIIKLLENKFPKENIIKSFGKNVVNLDIFSVEPKVHIYEVNESFLAVKED